MLISQKKPLCPPQKVQLDLSFARSIQKLLQLNRWCFGLGLGIIKTWEAKNSKFPDLLWRTRHLKSADFSTLKFQVLIVRLSQDLDSVHIFESEDHLDNRKKKIDPFFTVKRVGNATILVIETQDFGYLSIFEGESHLDNRIKTIWAIFISQTCQNKSNFQNWQYWL